MSPGLTAPRGTADVLPEQAAIRLRVEQTARELLEVAGYGRIAVSYTHLDAHGKLQPMRCL